MPRSKVKRPGGSTDRIRVADNKANQLPIFGGDAAAAAAVEANMVTMKDLAYQRANLENQRRLLVPVKPRVSKSTRVACVENEVVLWSGFQTAGTGVTADAVKVRRLLRIGNEPVLLSVLGTKDSVLLLPNEEVVNGMPSWSAADGQLHLFKAPSAATGECTSCHKNSPRIVYECISSSCSW